MMTSDDLSILGVDGIRRSFDEHYDTMMDVEQDPCGAHHAIHNQHSRIEGLEAENARLRDALYRIQDRSYGNIASIARAALQDTATDTAPKTSSNDASQ